MTDESLIILPRAYQPGAVLGHRPSAFDATKVIPIEIPHSRNSLAWRFNKLGNLEEVPINSSCLNWNLLGTKASWFLDVSRTNYITENNDLANTSKWLQGGSPKVTSNVDTWGILNGNRIVANANFDMGASNDDIIRRTSSWNVQVGANTISFIVKKSTAHSCISIRNYTSGTNFIVFNWNVDTLNSYVPFTSANYSNISRGVVSMGNGYFLCWVTFTSAAAFAGTFEIAPCDNNAQTGVSGNEIIFYAPQLEYGSYYTSRILTGASTVARLISTSTKTGITDLIGQTEGVLYLKFKTPSVILTGDILSINQSISNSVAIYISGGTLKAAIYHSAVQTVIFGPALTPDTEYSCAIQYKSGASIFSVNGVNSTSAAAISFNGALTSLFFLENYLAGPRVVFEFGDIKISKVTKTGAELIAETTL